MSDIEVLAPAGSYTSFKAAIAAGADAVYVGGRMFGARAFADNFTEEQLLEAIDYAHFHGRKLFLTVNTLLKDDEIKRELYDYLLPYYKQGLDAVIVQDVGVLEFITTHFPGLAIHASTQMTITNVLGAQFLKSKGAERIVPARELSLPEIHEMAEKTGLEIECFVHGALCYCYSGQCLLSSMIGGRSGNRGQCAQPCRLPYEVDGQTSYVLSPKDICTLELIPELIEAGIYSFKIEGRMKKPEYVAAVTSMYRKYVDLYFAKGREKFTVDPQNKQMLMDIYNRGGFDDGYYKKHNSANMISKDRPNHAGVKAFQILSQKGREVKGKALVAINKGDILELSENDNYTFGQSLKKGETFTLIGPKKKYYKAGDILSRTRNQKILDEVNNQYIETPILEKIKGSLKLHVGECAILTLSMGAVSTECIGEPVEAAKNQPMDKERIEKQMRKIGNTEFAWDELQIEIVGNVFLPMQQLNELRRRGLEELQKAVCATYHREMLTQQESADRSQDSDTDDGTKAMTSDTWKPSYAALVMSMEQLQIVAGDEMIQRIYLDCNLMSQILRNVSALESLLQNAKKNQKEIYFAMPHIFRGDAVKEYEQNYDELCRLAVDGMLIRNYESYQFLKEHGYAKDIVLDHNLYVFNHEAKKFWMKEQVTSYTAPLELNRSELKKLDISQSEFVAYGYLPMMISAGCVKKTTGRCDHISNKKIIKDRYKNQYTVKNYCDFCYNIIYNSLPLALCDEREELEQIRPGRLRLQFSLEDGAQTKQVLNLYQKTLIQNDDLCKPEFEFTRGHFRRGIK